MERLMFFYEDHILDSIFLSVLDILVAALFIVVLVVLLLVGPLDWGKWVLGVAIAYLGVRSISFLAWRIWLELPTPDSDVTDPLQQ